MVVLKEIDRSEALRHLAMGGKTPDRLTEALLNECEADLLPLLHPKYAYRVLPFETTANGIRPQGVRLTLPGNDIAAHLEGCSALILLCATLSSEADAYIRRMQVENLAKALVADAMLNAAIEQVCDLAESEIKAALPYPHYTDRFSPGYGDLPLSIQGDFLAALDAGRRLGVHIGGSDLMNPLKTVTAVIGAADEPLKSARRGCENCSKMNTCEFRKAGKRCDL